MSGWDVFSLVFLLLILLALFLPLLRQRSRQMGRLRLIRQLEAKRGSRLITLIHRQESISLLGIPVYRYIDIEDSEQILRAIRLTPDSMPIDLIIHTPGGLVLATEQIAHALKVHSGKVTVMIPHYAMSGGTLIALAADEILMDENAVMGPVDPQLQKSLAVTVPASSILQILQEKDPEHIEDDTLIIADVARKALSQVKNFVKWLLEDRGPQEAERIASLLSEGHWTHDAPLGVEILREIGFDIKTELPPQVYTLMELYPQPTGRRPTVQYIPIPYREKESKPKK